MAVATDYHYYHYSLPPGYSVRKKNILPVLTPSLQAKIPAASDPLLGSPCPKAKQLYRSFTYEGAFYQIGESVFVSPGTFGFKERRKEEEEESKKQRRDQTSYDEDEFPELYRKTKLASDYVKGSNLECPAVFEIGDCTVLLGAVGVEGSQVNTETLYLPPHTCMIGRIAEIFVKSVNKLNEEDPDVFLRLNVFYR